MAMELSRTHPNGQFVDRLFEQAFAPFFGSMGAGGTSIGMQTLPVNVWETSDGYQAAVLAPGLDEQSIDVTVHDDTLSIEGALTFQIPEGARTIWQEFAPARFRRSIRLSAAVDPAKVEALYQNGILLVTMPKAEHAKPRQIQVRTGEPAKGKK